MGLWYCCLCCVVTSTAVIDRLEKLKGLSNLRKFTRKLLHQIINIKRMKKTFCNHQDQVLFGRKSVKDQKI